MSADRKLLLAVVGMAAALGLLTTGAFAQTTQIGGVVTVKLSALVLSDPREKQKKSPAWRAWVNRGILSCMGRR